MCKLFSFITFRNYYIHYNYYVYVRVKIFMQRKFPLVLTDGLFRALELVLDIMVYLPFPQSKHQGGVESGTICASASLFMSVSYSRIILMALRYVHLTHGMCTREYASSRVTNGLRPGQGICRGPFGIDVGELRKYIFCY